MEMKNWDTLEADVNLIMDKHFTSGRTGKINKVVLHHNAGRLSVEQCHATWQTREASAHYQVQYDGVIGQLVWDRDTAWHAGPANATSIGIEHADDLLDPDWTISADTLENGTHLVAALCRFYGLGRPAWQTNVFGHRDFMSTACPGAIYAAQRDAYLKRAGEWYDQMAGAAPGAAPSTPSSKPYQGMAVPEVIRQGSGQYFGLITGPQASHGGHQASDRPLVRTLQQRLIACGFVPGVADVDSGWADGLYGQATADAVAAFQRAHMPATQSYGRCSSDDWTTLFNL
jgi:N-acetyl-anhydromuramyl-L-alanine amidase AmpD